MESNTDPYYGAPVVILVLADGSASTFVEDGSCVLENMMLAAHALGLGTVWYIVNVRFLTVKVARLSCESGSYRKPCVASGRLHWVIRPRKPSNPQHANKTILFEFNVPLSGVIFLRRTIYGEEEKYADR